MNNEIKVRFFDDLLGVWREVLGVPVRIGIGDSFWIMLVWVSFALGIYLAYLMIRFTIEGFKALLRGDLKGVLLYWSPYILFCVLLFTQLLTRGVALAESKRIGRDHQMAINQQYANWIGPEIDRVITMEFVKGGNQWFEVTFAEYELVNHTDLWLELDPGLVNVGCVDASTLEKNYHLSLAPWSSMRVYCVETGDVPCLRVSDRQQELGWAFICGLLSGKN